MINCTGIGASWCPLHGDCVCPYDDRTGRDLENACPTCPLHGENEDAHQHNIGGPDYDADAREP